ncbi:hypothetical protein [Bradyrhizobium sp. STM 3557]|uniref:hypothetical protein n=1 Tax=Bradyrhizobium sp. STM 3557 TaxID=578920 RepID=UPI00388F4F56
MRQLFQEERKEVWRGVRVVLALLFLEFINEQAKGASFVDEFAAAHGFEPEYIKIAFRIFVIVFVVVLLGLLEMVLQRKAAKMGRNRSHLKMFEGAWAQRSSIEERPYSLSFISFSVTNGRWEYFGIGFDKDCKPAAEWQTHSLFYDDLRHEWIFGGSAWLRTYDTKMGDFPRTGGQGSVTPILRLPIKTKSTDVKKLAGVVADFDVGSTRGPFRITLFSVPEKHRGAFSDLDTLLELAPAKVKEILSDSGVQFA